MKRIIIILCLCLAVFTSFGKKIVVIQVNKEGNSWQNLFNCYERVTTNLVGFENDVAQVTLDCEGGGYNWCRASRDIGSCGAAGTSSDILSNPAVIEAINSLIDQSEKAAKVGTRAGTSSKKVAIGDGRTSTLCFIKANWQYDSRNLSCGQVTITIEIDDSNLLRTAPR